MFLLSVRFMATAYHTSHPDVVGDDSHCHTTVEEHVARYVISDASRASILLALAACEVQYHRDGAFKVVSYDLDPNRIDAIIRSPETHL